MAISEILIELIREWVGTYESSLSHLSLLTDEREYIWKIKR